MCLHVFFRGKNISFLKLSSHQWNYNHGHFKIQAMLKSPSLNIVGSREFFFLSEMEIGAIMSSLAAHMVLPVGDAKPSWDSAASTISISDFGHNLSETCYLQGNEKQQGFLKWAACYSRSKDQTVYQLSQNVLCFCLWTLLYVTWRVLTFHCLSLIRSPAKRLQIQGLSLSLSCSVEGSHW